MTAMLTHRDLEDLLAARQEPCVSLYLPSHRHGRGAEQDVTRILDLLRQAEDRLADLGMAADEARRMLAPVRQQVERPELLEGLEEGVALFAAPGFSRVVTTRLPFAERLEVGRRFLIAPLVVALPVDTFHLLALSRNQVRLLLVGPAAAERLEPPGLPVSMEEALGYDQYESEVQVHSAGPRGLGQQPGIVHGHGDDDSERLDQDLLQYFRRVADALDELESPPGDDVPLVLAAVEEYVPLFREASRHRFALVSLPGSPDRLADGELARLGRDLVTRWSRRRLDEALLRWSELGDRSRVSDDIAQIVAAAYQGRVDTLFLAPGPVRWGTFEPDLCRVSCHVEREPGDDDLVDLAVSRTLSQGGVVIPLPDPALVPEGRPLAAILRY